ncbi:ALK and LTK ligand 2 [Carlito syrichta]|uniref:ALK and LTK ligand 2 n=1 Tax=Carlito syrichta TaxID=1868482 RepID=A0A1U7SR56_CARSF|nr:ALK and LTK ligand 2 [Carlito syrichta]
MTMHKQRNGEIITVGTGGTEERERRMTPTGTDLRTLPPRFVLKIQVLVLGAARPGCGGAELRESEDGHTLLRLIMELVQELKKYHSGEPKRLPLLGAQDCTRRCQEAAGFGPSPEEQRVEIVPRDLRMKDKFLKHLTGPLYFSPKCSKHFHRLYHNTRDCTIPAYYKRCARLLTRLAVSPVCMEDKQ